MNETPTPEPRATKPVALKRHLLTVSSADLAFQFDLTPYPGLTYGHLLVLPVAEIQRRWNLVP